MYSILNEALGWKEDALPAEKLMLVSDSLAADGAFLLPHFVNFYIKAKQRVVLVGLEQGFSHYLSVSKKLGVNLQQAHTTGQICFINGIAAPYDWTDAVTTETKNSATTAIQSIANAHPFSLPSSSKDIPSNDPMESLYRLIEKQVMTEDARSVCLIFDNLSALSPTVSEEQLLQFIHTCRSLIEDHASQNKNASCIVALAHSDVDSLLVNALSHSSDLVLKIEGFKTGYSNEEDGQLSFYTSDPFKYRDHKLPILIYKRTESTVNFRVVRK